MRLDIWRRSLPMAWWLTYDSLVAIALILAFVRPWLGLVIGIPWLLLAAFIDTIEYLAKSGRIWVAPGSHVHVGDVRASDKRAKPQ